MKPLITAVAVGATALLAWSCSGTAPTAPTETAPATVTTGGGHAAASDDADPNAPQAVYAIHPNPPEGRIPLNVRVNMCKSSDPQPQESLRFTVDWGDGAQDRGSCRLEHTYESAGTFRLTACVSDRVPGHNACEERVVEARGSAEPEPEPSLTPFVVLPLGDFVMVGPPIGPPSQSVAFRGLARIPSQAVANSATKVVVSLAISENTFTTGLVCGVSSDIGRHLDGAPDIAGRTGTVTYELTPGQFGPDIDAFSCLTGSSGVVRIHGNSVTFLR